MSDPLVSVCIPCHNADPYLRETLDSVLAQTYPRVEIVVVNDGSTDRSGAILEEYRAKHGVRVLQAKLGNAAAARNLAFRNSRGQFVKFLDADDLISNEMLAVQVARLIDRRGCVASSRWARFYDVTADAVFVPDGTWNDLSPIDWLVESFRAGDGLNMTQCGMFLIPRSLLERAGGWDERLTLVDDLEFFARLLTASEGVLDTEARLYYRSGLPTSLSSRSDSAALRSAARSAVLAAEVILRCEDSPRTRKVGADLLQHYFFRIAPFDRELGEGLQARVARLGGSAVRPSGGPLFEKLSRAVGWRIAARWRDGAIRFGYTGRQRRSRSNC